MSQAEYNAEPKLTAAYRFRGASYVRMGEFEKSVQDHIKEIELNPNDAITYRNRGHAYKKTEQTEPAWQDHSKAGEQEERINRKKE